MNAPITARTMTKRQYIILGTVLLISLFFGFWRIAEKGIWWDESLSLHRAQHDVAYILQGRIDFGDTQTTDQHPPLYFLLLSAVTRLFGDSDAALRSTSAVFAALCVWLLFVLGREIANSRIGLIAATLGAFSPLYLWYAQEARMYTMLTSLALLSTITLLRACKTRSLAWSIAWIATTAAGLFTQYMYVLLIPAQILTALYLQKGDNQARHRTRIDWRHLVISALLLALVSLGLVLAFSQASSGGVLTAIGRSYVLPHVILLDSLQSSLYGLSLAPTKMVALTIIAGLGSLLGLATLSHSTANRQGVRVLLLLWIIMPAVGIWLYSLIYGPVYMGSRYVIICSPAIYLLLSMSIDIINQKTRFIGWLLFIAILGGMTFSIHNYHFAAEYSAKEDHRGAAEHIMALERPGDCIILDAPENIDAFLHYYGGNLPLIPLPSDVMTGSPDPERLAVDLEKLTNTPEYTRFWLVQGRTMYSDPEHLVQAWLDEHLLFLGERFFPSSGSTIVVQSYAPAPELGEIPDDTDPLAVWDSQLALLAQSIRYRTTDGSIISTTTPLVGPDSPVLAPNQSVVVNWHLSALEPLPNYKISLRLTDVNDKLQTQSDIEPYLYFPSSLWPVNTIIRVETDIRIPQTTPSGLYDLKAVIYDALSGEPAMLYDGSESTSGTELNLGQIYVVANDNASEELTD